MSFTEDALVTGVAVNGHGMREASMGVASADWDADFDPDLFLTHDIRESNTLYSYQFPGWFSDVSVLSGLATPSFPKTGFGTGFFDVENDGDLDLFVANGSVSMIDTQRSKRIEPPLRQTNQLFLNENRSTFLNVEDTELSSNEAVSRGAAFGDLDNDGDVDIVVSNNAGLLRVYRNTSTVNGTSNNWVGLRLIAKHTEALGAVVWRRAANSERHVVRSDGSYASANDSRLIIGLGSDASPQTINVKWPDGTLQAFPNLDANTYHRIEQRQP